jgi:alkanesulfonate monooxygenase SsuD/methylene tetrahydromethanopterin reductase-like flavin-dependent oxidoreductase (luciferase family)
MERQRARAIIGTAVQVADRLRSLAASLAVEEVAVLTAAHDPEARRRSYALLAEAMALRPEDVATEAA